MPLDWASIEVAVSRDRLPGVAMAGFRQRVPLPPTEIAMVAYPAVTLFVDLSEGFVYDAGGRRSRGSAVVGLLPGRLIAGGAGLDCLQVRLQPAAATAILGETTALTGAVVSLADLWGREAARLEDRLRAIPDWNGRFALTAAVLRRSAVRRRVDSEIAYAWRRVVAGRGGVQVDELAGEIGWSRKKLWSRYRDQLGITPKRAAQLIRFDHAAHLLAAGRAPAEVAGSAGYADQSHLHREAKAFTGLTPSGVAAAPWLAVDPIAWPTR